MKPTILICAGCLLLAGCAGPKPILYPNDHYRQVGADAAESDIKDCMTLAEQAGASPSEGKTSQVATGTVAGGAIGSAAGAVGGGDSGTSGERGHGRRSQWRNGRVSAWLVQEIAAERGVYELCGSLFARARI